MNVDWDSIILWVPQLPLSPFKPGIGITPGEALLQSADNSPVGFIASPIGRCHETASRKSGATLRQSPGQWTDIVAHWMDFDRTVLLVWPEFDGWNVGWDVLKVMNRRKSVAAAAASSTASSRQSTSI